MLNAAVLNGLTVFPEHNMIKIRIVLCGDKTEKETIGSSTESDRRRTKMVMK